MTAKHAPGPCEMTLAAIQHAELLEALDGLFGWLQAHVEHRDEFFIQSMIKAEAAIRKAKGDQR